MSQRILLAGGGTAGHIEPALAVADEIRKQSPTAVCEFLGTDGALEELLVPSRGYKLNIINKVVLPRTLNFTSLLFPIRLINSVIQAMRALKDIDLLIGFGGYVSASAYLAAFVKRVPIIIHEANAKPGWANRLGRNFAKIAAVNFENVRRDWPGAVLTGMPIKESISALSKLADPRSNQIKSLNTLGLSTDLPVVAIFGGSQGSLHINKVVAEALPRLKDVQIIHAVGIKNDLPQADTNYHPMPYFRDMAAIYSCADLLITRSGAVTCSELAAVGKFAILIPLPHGNGEQVDNADALAAKGAAIRVSDADFSAEWLVANLNSALERAQRFKPAQTSENVNSAARIAELAFEVLGSKSKAGNSGND